MKLRDIVTIVLLFVCVLANTLPRHMLTEPTIENGQLFCMWVAFSFVLLALAFMANGTNVFIAPIKEFVVLSAANDFIDEYYKVAEQVNPFEMWILKLALIWLAIRVTYIAWTNSKKRLSPLK